MPGGGRRGERDPRAARPAARRPAHKEISLRGSIGISVARAEATGAAPTSSSATPTPRCTSPSATARAATGCSSPRCTRASLARLELRTDLQRALATDQLELHYQPVVRLDDGSVSGVEALLRWRHPERGLIPPDEFIPLAEETGPDHPDRALGAARGLPPRPAHPRRAPDGEALTMSMNLSLKQIQHSDIVADVRDALEEAGLEPSRADARDHRDRC